MQASLFPVASSWKPPSDFPELDGNFSLDLETKDSLLNTRGPGWAFDVDPEIRGYVVGYGIGAPGYQGYFPIRHADGGNLDEEPVLRWLRAQCKKRGDKVFFNGLYDLGWAGTDGIEIHPEDFHDAQYLAALIDENQPSYKLDFCLNKYLGEKKDETLLQLAANDMRVNRRQKINPKEVLWMLHSRYVGPYGEQDGGGTWRLYEHLFGIAENDELMRVYDVERRLMPILLKMRRKGVRVDLDRAATVSKTLREKELEALSWIQRETGCRAREGVPSADAAQILRKLGVSLPKTATGADSVVAKWLETIDHPVGKAIVRARRYNKARRDYVDSLHDVHVNGRVHASFHPLMSDEGGTVTGRFSCTNPNLQQIPSRDPEIGPLVRSIYVGDEDEKWGKFDYSSQEPRWTLHFASSIKAPGAAEGVRRFRDDPRTDFHGMMTNMIWPEFPTGSAEWKAHRRKAKDIFLGLCYGMGGAKLCDTLGLPTEWVDSKKRGRIRVAGAAGKELFEKFNDMAPFVQALTDKVSKVARERGYVKTYLGRRCHIEGYEHKGLNRIIQGTSADQTKLAILNVYNELGYVPLLQVHDELGYSVHDDRAARDIADVMENCVDCVVPHVVDPYVANSWGECK